MCRHRNGQTYYYVFFFKSSRTAAIPISTMQSFRSRPCNDLIYYIHTVWPLLIANSAMYLLKPPPPPSAFYNFKWKCNNCVLYNIIQACLISYLFNSPAASEIILSLTILAYPMSVHDNIANNMPNYNDTLIPAIL